MAAINFDQGLAGIVLAKYSQTTQKPVNKIRLYTAISAAISKDTLLSHFTEVGPVMGYVAKTVAGGDFATVLDTTNHWVTASAAYTWIFTAGAGLTILGWYATDGATGVAIEGEQFAAAVVIPAGGGNLQVTINDKYKDC